MNGIIILTSLAFILGNILIILDYHFNKSSKEVLAIEEMLPGYNCGACGHGGCRAMAESLAKGEDVPKNCKPMKEEPKIKLEEYLKKQI